MSRYISATFLRAFFTSCLNGLDDSTAHQESLSAGNKALSKHQQHLTSWAEPY
jgi:hypothetical protein